MKWVDPYDKNKYIVEDEKYIVAKGGDGTLLRAVRMYPDTAKTFIGIAGGTANFLMNSVDYDVSKAEEIKLRLISVTVETANDSGTFNAFNEVVIGSFCGWNKFEVKDADQIIGNFQGAGVLFSTTQGSTGLSKNNGGTIMPLSSKNWIVSGMQVDRNINYIIAPNKVVVEVTSRNTIEVLVDGQKVVTDEKHCRITVTQGREVSLLVGDLIRFKRKRQHS